MRRLFEIGGLLAGVVLIGFGIGALVLGINGRSTVHDSLKLEKIVGTPDMTPAAIAAEAKKAGLPASIKLPTVDVAGKAINNGDRARAFASPLDNAARQVWITETALSTALNTSYMAEQLSIFGIVVGVALLLTGIGLLVLTLGGALRHRTQSAPAVGRRREPASVAS